jgi:hypothetical protein
VLDRLGLGHAVLRARNPRLIVCALTGYGQTGPLAQRAGHDINVTPPPTTSRGGLRPDRVRGCSAGVAPTTSLALSARERAWWPG